MRGGDVPQFLTLKKMTQVSQYADNTQNAPANTGIAQACADVFGADVVPNADTSLMLPLLTAFPRIAPSEYVIACQRAALGVLDLSDQDVTLYGKPLNLAFMSRILRAYTKNKIIKKYSGQGYNALPAAKKGSSQYWPNVAGRIFDDPGTISSMEVIYKLMMHADLVKPNINTEAHARLSNAARKNVKASRIATWRSYSDECRPVDGYDAIIAGMARGDHDLAIKIEFRRLATLHVLAVLRAGGMQRAELIGILNTAQNMLS